MSVVLRDYQVEAVDRISEEFEEKLSTLLVIPTGTGKSTVFCECARRHLEESATNSVVILSHRRELVYQARDRMERMSGLPCGVEMAEESVFNDGMFAPRVVSASIDTLRAKSRRNPGKIRAADFAPTLVVYDEAHHATTDGAASVIAAFRDNNPQCRLLGVTATPDRHDEEALGQVFESVAYEMTIRHAVEQGWLVRPIVKRQRCDELDISRCRTAGGDLKEGDLAEVLEKNDVLYAMVVPMVKRIQDRWRTIIFGLRVKQLDAIRDIIDAQRGEPDRKHGKCVIVHGKTPEDAREASLRAFAEGTYQMLANVAICTEGWDDPATDERGVQCIALLRPTKSRALMTQMIGRGLRPLPGILDGLDTAVERKAAIAASAKPACFVLDFCGTVGKHKLAHAGDILGGKVRGKKAPPPPPDDDDNSDGDDILSRLEEEERMERIREEERKAERDRERHRKIHGKVDARYSEEDVDPFGRLNIAPRPIPTWFKGKETTENQRRFLAKYGVTGSQVPKELGLSVQLLDALTKKPTIAQAARLRKMGLEPERFNFKTASATIDNAAAETLLKG